MDRTKCPYLIGDGGCELHPINLCGDMKFCPLAVCAASEWRPIAEVPRDGTEQVLLFVEGQGYFVGMWCGKTWVVEDCSNCNYVECFSDDEITAFATINPPEAERNANESNNQGYKL